MLRTRPSATRGGGNARCARNDKLHELNPTTAPYRPNTFKSMIGCDVKAIYDANGLKFEALNIVDLATGFQILAALDGPSSTECAEKLWLWWVLWAGPPKTIVSDLGASFRTAFQMMVERYGASSCTAPIESPWQISMVERHGGVIREIVAIIVNSSNVVGKKEMTLTSIAATATKNRRPGLHGHSPRSAVFGMDDRLDGCVIDSLLDGEQLPMHSQAATDARYQRALRIRQDTMKAIGDLDHSQKYHRAIAMRTNLEGPRLCPWGSGLLLAGPGNSWMVPQTPPTPVRPLARSWHRHRPRDEGLSKACGLLGLTRWTSTSDCSATSSSSRT